MTHGDSIFIYLLKNSVAGEREKKGAKCGGSNNHTQGDLHGCCDYLLSPISTCYVDKLLKDHSQKLTVTMATLSRPLSQASPAEQQPYNWISKLAIWELHDSGSDLLPCQYLGHLCSVTTSHN